MSKVGDATSILLVMALVVVLCVISPSVISSLMASHNFTKETESEELIIYCQKYEYKSGGLRLYSPSLSLAGSDLTKVMIHSRVMATDLRTTLPMKIKGSQSLLAPATVVIGVEKYEIRNYELIFIEGEKVGM
jgi:hypothetical protein